LSQALSDRALLKLLAAVTALGPISTNLYLPVLPLIRDDFGATVAEVQATFSVGLVMFALGLLFWGPFSDRFGRRVAVISGLSILGAGAIGSMVAPTLPLLTISRGIQAFGIATGMVVARAIVTDLFPAERMVKMLAQLTMVAVLGNMLAPVLGGYLGTGFGWRSIFLALVVTALAVGFLVWRYLPETRPPQTAHGGGRAMFQTVLRLLKRPLFVGCVLQSGAIYATFLVFISLAPYVMVSALGRPPTEYGYYYLFVAVGYFLGNWSVSRLLARHDVHWMVAVGVVLQVAGALAALGFVALGLRHPLWIFAPVAVLSYGQGLALPNVTATAVSLEPQHAGVGSSAIGFLQMLIGSVCVQAMGVFPTDTPFPMLIFAAATCLLALGMLWIFPRGGTPR